MRHAISQQSRYTNPKSNIKKHSTAQKLRTKIYKQNIQNFQKMTRQDMKAYLKSQGVVQHTKQQEFDSMFDVYCASALQYAKSTLSNNWDKQTLLKHLNQSTPSLNTFIVVALILIITGPLPSSAETTQKTFDFTNKTEFDEFFNKQPNSPYKTPTYDPTIGAVFNDASEEYLTYINKPELNNISGLKFYSATNNLPEQFQVFGDFSLNSGTLYVNPSHIELQTLNLVPTRPIYSFSFYGPYKKTPNTWSVALNQLTSLEPQELSSPSEFRFNTQLSPPYSLQCITFNMSSHTPSKSTSAQTGTFTRQAIDFSLAQISQGGVTQDINGFSFQGNTIGCLGSPHSKDRFYGIELLQDSSTKLSQLTVSIGTKHPNANSIDHLQPFAETRISSGLSLKTGANIQELDFDYSQHLPIKNHTSAYLTPAKTPGAAIFQSKTNGEKWSTPYALANYSFINYSDICFSTFGPTKIKSLSIFNWSPTPAPTPTPTPTPTPQTSTRLLSTSFTIPHTSTVLPPNTSLTSTQSSTGTTHCWTTPASSTSSAKTFTAHVTSSGTDITSSHWTTQETTLPSSGITLPPKTEVTTTVLHPSTSQNTPAPQTIQTTYTTTTHTQTKIYTTQPATDGSTVLTTTTIPQSTLQPQSTTVQVITSEGQSAKATEVDESFLSTKNIVIISSTVIFSVFLIGGGYYYCKHKHTRSPNNENATPNNNESCTEGLLRRPNLANSSIAHLFRLGLRTAGVDVEGHPNARLDIELANRPRINILDENTAII